MKYFLLSLILLISSFCAQAIDDTGKLWSFGMNAELGLSNVAGEGDTPGFGSQIGVIANYHINQDIFTETGLIFSCVNHSERELDGTISALYTKLPIQIGIQSRISDYSHLTVQVGPTLSYGIRGTKFHTGGHKYDYFDIMRRFDLGIEGKVGVLFQKVRWTLGVNYGVISPVKYLNYHNLTVFIGGTVFFGHY